MPVYQDRKVGTYRAIYMGCTEKLMGDPEELRFIWRFQEKNDKTTLGQLDKITSTNIKNTQANAYKMMFGILGRKPQDGDDTETHIGEEYDVTWGPNQVGNLTIVNVAPATPEARPATLGEATRKAADEHAKQEGDVQDDLPF